MQVFAGTSGFSTEEWQGRFYPKGLAADQRLEYYASRLHSVEINNTFYQLPKPELLARWSRAVPDGFRFALKAPRRFTHSQRLKIAGDWLQYFFATVSALGQKLGPVLFQLPPFVSKDAPLLTDFLAQLPGSVQVALEFRHRSWYDDEIYTLLANKNVALCGGDSDKPPHSPPSVATANFGYLRLRAPNYDAKGLRSWSERILAERWTNAYVYLKHDVFGPDYALFLAAVASGTPEPALPVEMNAAAAAAAVPPPKKGLVRAKPRSGRPAPNVHAPAATRRRKAG